MILGGGDKPCVWVLYVRHPNENPYRSLGVYTDYDSADADRERVLTEFTLAKAIIVPINLTPEQAEEFGV